MGQRMLVAAAEQERRNLAGIVAELEMLYQKAMQALQLAESATQPGHMCIAIREARQVLELVYRMYRDHTQPEWLHIARQIAAALEPYPEARQAVLTVLRQHGHLP